MSGGPFSDNMPDGTDQRDLDELPEHDDGFGRDEGYGDSQPKDEPTIFAIRASLQRQKKEVERLKKSIDEKIERCDREILKQFEKLKMRSVRNYDDSLVSLAASLRSRMKDGVTSAKIAQVLAQRSHTDLLMGSAQTIKSYVKERIDDWELEHEQEFDGDWQELVPELADLYEFDQTPVVRVTGA